MQESQAQPGKKVKLSVHQDQAQMLREKGQEFFNALQGRTIEPNGKVLFGDVVLFVESTKPKGPVQVMGKTAIKMAITKKPIGLTCPGCGQMQPEPQDACAACGSELPVVSL